MPPLRPTYEALIAEVRRHIAVDADTAWSYLLDRSRVLNAEANWLVVDGVQMQALYEPTGMWSEKGRYWSLPEDGNYAVWIEAIWEGPALGTAPPYQNSAVPTRPYHRSTHHAMDARTSGLTGNTSPIYCEFVWRPKYKTIVEVHPWTAGPMWARYVIDVVDDRTEVPPFPTDFDQALVDGAVAMGLARMDERFDSASYFDQRFATAIGRLRRRRHGRVGRGAVPIRVAM